MGKGRKLHPATKKGGKYLKAPRGAFSINKERLHQAQQVALQLLEDLDIDTFRTSEVFNQRNGMYRLIYGVGHAWIERKNGEIYDPSEKFTRKEQAIHQAKDIIREEWSPKVSAVIHKVMKKTWESKVKADPMLEAKFKEQPEKGSCYYNCYAKLPDFPDGEVKYGKFGWTKPDGTTWWEYDEFNLHQQFAVDLDWVAEKVSKP